MLPHRRGPLRGDGGGEIARLDGPLVASSSCTGMPPVFPSPRATGASGHGGQPRVELLEPAVFAAAGPSRRGAGGGRCAGGNRRGPGGAADDATAREEARGASSGSSDTGGASVSSTITGGEYFLSGKSGDMAEPRANTGDVDAEGEDHHPPDDPAPARDAVLLDEPRSRSSPAHSSVK